MGDTNARAARMQRAMRTRMRRQINTATRGLARARHAGIGLVVALVLLVVISLAAVALVRVVEGSSMVAGNAAFRQAALLAADAGNEAALAWLVANPTLLDADHSADGYYASLPAALDANDSGPGGGGSSSGSSSGTGTGSAAPPLSARSLRHDSGEVSKRRA